MSHRAMWVEVVFKSRQLLSEQSEDRRGNRKGRMEGETAMLGRLVMSIVTRICQMGRACTTVRHGSESTGDSIATQQRFHRAPGAWGGEGEISVDWAGNVTFWQL